MPFWCAIYVLLILLLGYGTLCMVAGRQRRGLEETVGLSLLLGAGAMGLVFFWISLAGGLPSRTTQFCIAGVCAVVLGWLIARRRLVVPQSFLPLRKSDAMAIAPAAILAYALVVVAIGALAFPVYYSDAYANWILKAKVLIAEPLRSRPAVFFEPCMSYSHQDYPLMLPLLTAGLYGMLGSTNDQAGKLVGVVLYAGLLLSLYGFFRKELSRTASATLTALLMALPAMLQYTGIGIADAPLAVFYAGAVFHVAQWVRHEKAEDLTLAILFTAYAAFTKNEGKAMAALISLALAAMSLPGLRKRRLLGCAAFVGGIAVLLTPWLLWARGLPHTVEMYETKFALTRILSHFDYLGFILPAFLGQATQWALWGPFWVLLPLMAALGWRGFGRRHVAVVWLIAGLHLATYIGICTACPRDLAEAILDRGTLVRILLHVAPAVILLIGWHGAARLLPPETKDADVAAQASVSPPASPRGSPNPR